MRMFLTDKSEKISNDFAILRLLCLYWEDNQAMCEVSEVQRKISLWWNFTEWQELLFTAGERRVLELLNISR